MTRTLEFQVIKGKVLGIPVYRGFARLSDLAEISRPDVYDQEKNPTGTQRDLNRQHAREAYEYVRARTLAFFPEIVLNARDSSVLSFTPMSEDGLTGTLTVDVQAISEGDSVALSRVDGNHRLFFADGHEPNFPPLDEVVGFCITYDLSEADPFKSELLIFRDINANQKGMNTSHLDSIALRTAETSLKTVDPSLYVAERLMDDKDSPFKGRVYRGGIKPSDVMIPLRNLKTSVQYMRERSKMLVRLDASAQAELIKRFWRATKSWIPAAWEKPRDYVALRSTGFWALSFIGADVIDRVVITGKLEGDEMLAVLKSGKSWDWSNAGDFRGFGGRGGATQIANMVTKEFAGEGPSIAEIESRLANG